MVGEIFSFILDINNPLKFEYEPTSGKYIFIV